MDLQLLRQSAGGVSYATIATRIAERRMRSGESDAAARVARSTVFDAFRTGRSRVNPDLIAEIAAALGADEVAANAWRQRCIEAQAGGAPR